MIKVNVLFKDNDVSNGCVCGFSIKNHGDPIVCAGVSALTINAVNSIEAFTQAGFTFDGDAQNGGDITFRVTDFDDEGRAELLLQSLYLGLVSLAERYVDDITVSYGGENYDSC